MKPTVFLDRDGTVIVEKHYLGDPAGVELLPGAAEGLRRLSAAGYQLVLVTNQSGVSRGYFTEADVQAVHARLAALLAEKGVAFDGIFYCPHHPSAGCACRKPGTGMIDDAAAALDVDMGRSVVIGDKPCDIEMGQAAGLATILVRTGYGAEFADDPGCGPDVVVSDLVEAAQSLLSQRTPNGKSPSQNG